VTSDELTNETLGIIVVGDTPWRSASLIDFIHAQTTWPVELVPSVRVNASMSPSVDMHLAERLMGRPLVGGEVGCSLAHRRAYEISEQRGWDWTLLLEDDAVISPDLHGWLSSDTVRDLSRRPTIVSMFTLPAISQARMISKPDVPVPLRGSPSHTVAYLINRAAVQMAISSPERVVSSADWPPWTGGVAFQALAHNRYVDHATGTTILGREATMLVSKWKKGWRLISGSDFRASKSYFHCFACFARWRLAPPMRRLGLLRARGRSTGPGIHFYG
jgi:hypothetical protein